ncbi:ABC transporter substrate-binding protein [Sinomonas halotolerans]|uniref:Extracellular solute-binding protein n=1 Tax=Sinomonas halotolerans TaxID=1644133 RepID=A0ABU9X1Y9_9MICC
MFRKIVSAAFVLGVAVTATSCAGLAPQSSDGGSPRAIPTATPEGVTISFWDRYCDDGVKKVVSDFNEAYKGKVEVEHVCVSGGESNLAAKIQAAAVGGGLPNVSALSEQNIVQYANDGLVVPLDPYLEDQAWGLKDEERKDLTESAIARTELPVYGGKTMSWPFGNTANALYVNTDLLKAAGIKEAPSTWDEFYAAAAKIKKATGKPGWAMAPSDGANLIDAVWSSGTPWIDGNGKVLLGDAATADVLKGWKDLSASGSATVSESYRDLFLSGNAGMVFSSTGFVGKWTSTAKSAWEVAPFPHAEGKEPLTEMFGSASVVFKSTPEEELASWLFAKYAASAQAQATMCPEQGCLPATASSLELPEIKALIAEAPQYRTALEEIAPTAQLLPQDAALAEVRGKVSGDVLTRVLNGSVTPEQGAQELGKRATAAVEAAK